MASGISDHLFAITGAASGIGRATAELLAKDGALLTLADFDGYALQRLADNLGKSGASVHWKKVDVRTQGAVEEWVQEAVEKFGRPLDGKLTSTRRIIHT